MQIFEPNKTFIISSDTLLLQTVRKENRLGTLVIEADEKLLFPRKSLHIIRTSCNHYGTDLNVVTHSARKILHDRHKVPIVLGIDRGFPLIMFPTLSTKSDYNIWIALHAISTFKSAEPGYTLVTLTNNFIAKVPVSEAIIQRQIALAHLLKVNYQRRFFHFNGNLVHRPTTRN